MSALSIATDGWLDGPIGIATSGYLAVSVPANVSTESILNVFMDAGLPNLTLFEADGKLLVSVEGEYKTSLGMRTDLLNKTVEFFTDHMGLELESYSDTTIKFISNDVSVDMKASVVGPLEATDIDHS